MKKLEKFKLFIDSALKGFTRNDVIFGFILFLIAGLSFDLKLETAFNVSSYVLTALLMWYLCTFVCMIIYSILKRKYEKKSNIEKLIDN